MADPTEAEQANQAEQHQPSGPKADSRATAGPGTTQVASNTPENREGQINPSAPNDAITPPQK